MGQHFHSFDSCKIPLDRRLEVRSRIVHLLASYALETSEMDNPNQIDPNDDFPTSSREDSRDTFPKADDDFPPLMTHPAVAMRKNLPLINMMIVMMMKNPWIS